MPRDTWDKERLDVQHTGHSEERPSACAYSGCNSGSWSVNLALRYMTRVSSRIVSFMTPVFFFLFLLLFFSWGSGWQCALYCPSSACREQLAAARNTITANSPGLVSFSPPHFQMPWVMVSKRRAFRAMVAIAFAN